MLLTNLANAVQPVIRYDLGDSVVAAAGTCGCGSALPAIRVQGRCDDVLRFPGGDGRVVSIPPLTIGSVADETPGVRRSQLVQTLPATLRIRLDVEPGANLGKVWDGVRVKVATHLAAQGVRDVEIVRGEERPQQTPGSGKYRQVISGH